MTMSSMLSRDPDCGGGVDGGGVVTEPPDPPAPQEDIRAAAPAEPRTLRKSRRDGMGLPVGSATEGVEAQTSLSLCPAGTQEHLPDPDAPATAPARGL